VAFSLGIATGSHTRGTHEECIEAVGIQRLIWDRNTVEHEFGDKEGVYRALNEG
jgi:hypothetical protein